MSNRSHTNYSLKRCMDENPRLQLPDPLTLRTSLRSLRLNLRDELSRRLVSFREASRLDRRNIMNLENQRGVR